MPIMQNSLHGLPTFFALVCYSYISFSFYYYYYLPFFYKKSSHLECTRASNGTSYIFYIDFVYLLFLCVVTVGSKCNVALSKLERERE